MADDMIPAPTALDLATTGELIDELGRRTLSCVVSMAFESKNDREHRQWVIDYRGDVHMAVGLASRTKFEMERQVADND